MIYKIKHLPLLSPVYYNINWCKLCNTLLSHVINYSYSNPHTSARLIFSNMNCTAWLFGRTSWTLPAALIIVLLTHWVKHLEKPSDIRLDKHAAVPPKKWKANKYNYHEYWVCGGRIGRNDTQREGHNSREYSQLEAVLTTHAEPSSGDDWV